MKLNWDTEIPSDLIKQWNDLLKILNGLDFIEVNRKVLVNYQNDSIAKRELHGFSKASLRAYRAAIYFKTILQPGKVHTNFFIARHVLPHWKKSLYRV